MGKKTAALLPSTNELLRQFGDRLRLARLRRRLSAKQVAERAGMSPMTLRSVERGGAGVTIGAYLAVMQVLGVEKDFDLIVHADPVGRELQDARLPRSKSRARRKPATSTASTQHTRPGPSVAAPTRESPSIESTSAAEETKDAKDWIEEGGYISSETLADLIDPVESRPKKRR